MAEYQYDAFISYRRDTRAGAWVSKFFAETLTGCLMDALGGEAVKQLKLPHVPFWNFGEELPVKGESLAERDTLSAAYGALARLLGGHLDWNEVSSLDASKYPRARPGHLEVWLPPLRSPLVRSAR